MLVQLVQLGFCIFLHATWLATLACLAKRLSVSVFSASLEVTFYFLFKPWLNIWGPAGLWPHLTRALPGALPGAFCFAPKSRTASASPSSPTTQPILPVVCLTRYCFGSARESRSQTPDLWTEGSKCPKR